MRQQNLHTDSSGALHSQIEAFKEDIEREKSARLEAESQNRKLYQRIESVMEQHSKLQKVSFEFERLMRENNSKNDDIFELQQKFDSVTAEKHQIMSLKIDVPKFSSYIVSFAIKYSIFVHKAHFLRAGFLVDTACNKFIRAL